MAFSQKTIYALRATFELSKRQGQGPVSITELAAVQVTPPDSCRMCLFNSSNPGLWNLFAARMVDTC